MQRRWLWQPAVLAWLALGIGCGGGDGPSGNSGPSLDGTWDGGAIPGPGVFLNVTITLTDAAGDLTGQGDVGAPGVACSAGVTGDRRGDNFDITLSCPGYAPWIYSGSATATRLNGTFNGSGFTNFQFAMARQ